MNPTPAPERSVKQISLYDFLIVGYGDECRGDAGVGPAVARTVQSWKVPGIIGVASSHLPLTLSAELSKAEYAIFVTACPNVSPQQIQICPLTVPSIEQTHAITSAPSQDPVAILSCTQALYGFHPQAWQIKVPISQFDQANTLSETAKQGISCVLSRIELFIRNYQVPQLCGCQTVACDT